MISISGETEFTPEKGDDILLKLTMPGKELRQATVEKQEQIERELSTRKVEQQLSPDPNVDLLSSIARPHNGHGEFIDNMKAVNSQLDQTIMQHQPLDASEIIGIKPKQLTIHDPILNPQAAPSLPVDEPCFLEESDIFPSSQEGSGELEVKPAVHPQQKSPESQPVQRPADVYDQRNIFGRVQPEREDSRPTAPPHMMNQGTIDKVIAHTQRIFDSDLAVKRLRK